MNSNPNPISGDRRWIIQICQTINEDIEEEDIDIPVSIFNVPTSLVSTKPDCYIPQQVALGPYHHWRPELYEMERYKISAARRYQKLMQDGGRKFNQIVNQLAVFEPRIRACYHKYLDFDGETLIWIMALDVSFLLGFLDVYHIEKSSSKTSNLVGFSCRKFAHDAILRDIMMLENQIPIFLLEKMLEFQFNCLESAQKSLTSMLIGFCKEVSPFRITDVHQIHDCSHVLGFLYHMIVDPRIEEQCFETTDQEDQQEKEEEEETQHKFKGIINGVQRFLERLKLSVKLIGKFAPGIISNIPIARIFKDNIFTEDKQVLNLDQCDHKPPLTEEISIPSVTDLSKAGFQFSPSSGGIFTISFDENTSVFFLPVVSLDVNTDVVLRNLIAYEVCNASGPLILTRYTDLMNGIIDTKEDAKLLRERGIMVNRLKNDEEVAKLWNGLSRSVRLTKVPFLDKVIEDVNKNYERTLRVKIKKVMKVYVFESWPFLVFVAVLILLLLMSLEVFSSVCRFILMVFIRTIV